MAEIVKLRTPKQAANPPGAQTLAGRRVYIETYGCQMNVADTELVSGLLQRQSASDTNDPADAQVILLNTCAVREKAEERVFARIAELKKHKANNPDVILGVIGCMAEHLKESILERAPEVDLVAGPDAYRRLPELLAGPSPDHVVDTKLDKTETYGELDPKVDDNGVSGFVTIQRGCDKFCTFCVVPFTRGRERGVAPRDVLRRVRAFAQAGYKEVTLLGQTVNSYVFEDISFAQLLRSVATVDGIERIRFTSPYPIDFGPDVVAAIAEESKICPQVHLPLQSGSDVVLKRMKRGYTREDFMAIVRNLRDAVPDIALSTDIMTGFSGETDEDHQQTLSAMEEVGFDSAFMFQYSERSLTAAAKKLPDDISPDIKRARITDIIRLQETISKAKNQLLIGSIQEVLISGPSKRDPNQSMGRTPHFKTVILDQSVTPGQTVQARITSGTMATLQGTLLPS